MSNNTNSKGEQMGELNEKTVMPMSLVVGCVVAFVGGAIWINSSLSEIKYSIAAIQIQLSDRWTGSDMKLWVARLKFENPTLTVPSTKGE